MTFIVNRKDDPSNEVLEFTLNGVMIGKAATRGAIYEFHFTPGKGGVTGIREISRRTFGTSSIIRTIHAGPGGVEQYTYAVDGGGNRSITSQTLNSGLDVSTLKVSLEDQLQEREIASEIVEVPVGAKRTVKRSRTIEHSVSQTGTRGAEGAGKLDLGIVSGEIRGKIEQSRSTTYRQSETVEQSVEIDGKELPKARLVWVERALTGRATVLYNGRETDIPFTFSENLELRVIPVK